MTYEDWIKSLNTRDLAKFINVIEKGCELCIYAKQDICPLSDCVAGREAWLKLERKSVDNDTYIKDIT